jgi:hypothetical protein
MMTIIETNKPQQFCKTINVYIVQIINCQKRSYVYVLGCAIAFIIIHLQNSLFSIH